MNGRMRNEERGVVAVILAVIGFVLVLILVGYFAGERPAREPVPVTDKTPVPPSPATPNTTLKKHQSGALVESGCQIGGCSSEICTVAGEEPPVSTCEARPEYQCYRSTIAQCVSTGTGTCDWKETDELNACRAYFAE